MLNLNVLAFVGIAVFAVLSLVPIVAPAAMTFIDSMQFSPR